MDTDGSTLLTNRKMPMVGFRKYKTDLLERPNLFEVIFKKVLDYGSEIKEVIT